jgi:predicted dehydrogenase
VHAVNFPYRPLPPLQTLAAWLRARGPVRAATVHVRNGFVARGEARSDGEMLGASGDFGGVSHVLDAALWLLDAAPLTVQATLVGRPVHDVGLHLELAGGAVLHLAHVAGVAPGIAGTWHLVGDDWEVRFTGGYEPALGGWQIGPVLAASRDDNDWHALAAAVSPPAGRREPWAEAHVTTARWLLAAIAGHDRAALASLADGARVQVILAAAMRSQLEGRRVVLADAPA